MTIIWMKERKNLFYLVPDFDWVIGMRLHQGLGRVEAEVDVASRSQIPDKNNGSLETEVQKLWRKGLLLF